MRGHRVQFVDMDLTTFAAELASRVGGRSAGPVPSPNGDAPAPATDAPSVFVCHAHEDAAEAERVSAGLRANRFDVWLDKDALEGGDDWNAAIEQRILRDTDYVVVLQSANLLHKEVGYVNKEISLAFDRQQQYRPPRRFIIPTVVDDPTNQLVELSTWQYVDLRRADGIDEIVKAIRVDLDRATRFG